VQQLIRSCAEPDRKDYLQLSGTVKGKFESIQAAEEYITAKSGVDSTDSEVKRLQTVGSYAEKTLRKLRLLKDNGSKRTASNAASTDNFTHGTSATDTVKDALSTATETTVIVESHTLKSNSVVLEERSTCEAKATENLPNKEPAPKRRMMDLAGSQDNLTPVQETTAISLSTSDTPLATPRCTTLFRNSREGDNDNASSGDLQRSSTMKKRLEELFASPEVMYEEVNPVRHHENESSQGTMDLLQVVSSLNANVNKLMVRRLYM